MLNYLKVVQVLKKLKSGYKHHLKYNKMTTQNRNCGKQNKNNTDNRGTAIDIAHANG